MEALTFRFFIYVENDNFFTQTCIFYIHFIQFGEGVMIFFLFTFQLENFSSTILQNIIYFVGFFLNNS